MEGKVIALEGNIGSGKTTACHCLMKKLQEKNYPVRLFEEEVNMDFLTLFLSDPKNYAFAFQTYMLSSRIYALKQAHEFASTGGISLIDRSIVGDRAFALLHYENGNISEEQWKVYQSLYNANVEVLPHKTIYLTCDPKICLERIARRDRSGEKKCYTLDYIKDLSEKHEISIRLQEMLWIVRINWNQDRDINSIADVLIKICI